MFSNFATFIGLLYVLPRPNFGFFFLLCNYLFGLRLYVLRRKEDCKALLRHMNFAGTFTERSTPFGLSFSLEKRFVCTIDIGTSDYGDTYSGWLFCSLSTYQDLMQDDFCEIQVQPQATEAFSIIEKISSCHRNIYFRKRPLKKVFVPKEPQEEIVNAIERHYVDHGRTVCFISGPPGVGKSMVGLLVAQKLKGLYCNTFKPWNPGETLSALHTDADPTADKPLIISLDDFDIGLSGLLANEPTSEEYTIQVHNKDSWNTFLDNIERHLFPHIIVVLTTNKTIQDLEAIWCKSLLRPGRIGLYFSLDAYAMEFKHSL